MILPGWKHYRAIHSRFPPANLFDTVSDEAALLLAELEGETSDRLVRWRERVSPDDARFGSGWGAVMASFCYATEGRFNTSAFGADYCADSVPPASAEWSHHAARVWSDFNFSDEASATIRIYSGRFEQPLVDARKNARVHHLSDYAVSRAFAEKQKREGRYGILYRSVRRKGSEAAALLRPPATSPVTQAGHYSILWNGRCFSQFAKLNAYENI